jgi:polyhydroxyalkanoate synthesis repressor PhaR
MVGVVGSSPIAPTSLCLALLPARRFAKTLLQTPKQDILLARKSSSTSNHSEADPKGEVATRLIKKYPNRRLYDTQTSSYITLQEVKAFVVAGEVFKVVEAKSNEDLTRSILLQIILEEESGGVPMFSEVALANIIRFYGHAMQGFMGNYLEKNVQTFIDLQMQMADQSKHLSPELWAQVMTTQSPVLKGLMGSYTEQSQEMLTQMQKQMLAAMGLKR